MNFDHFCGLIFALHQIPHPVYGRTCAVHGRIPDRNRLYIFKRFFPSRNGIPSLCEPGKSPNKTSNCKNNGNEESIEPKNTMKVIVLPAPSRVPFDAESLLCHTFTFRPPENDTTDQHHQEDQRSGGSDGLTNFRWEPEIKM